MIARILLVDDDKNLLYSCKRCLRTEYNLDVASSPQEALELISVQGPYAVAVSDLRMPGMCGIEFLARLRREQPDTVRILLTAYADLDSAIKAVNQGHIFRLLTKPCSDRDIAAAILAGLEQHKLVQDQRELYALKNLKQAMEGIILGFTALVESRDPYTAGHQRRVAELSVAIAERMDLDQERITGLRLAALVHDVGKIAVPAEFLNKPGSLSDTEFSIIKEHPGKGHEILKSVAFTWPVSTLVLQHHERLDGSGYPNRLRGPEILLEAQILAVADVLDAMASHRPYRPALGMTRALDELRAGSGRLYNTKAVEACLLLAHEEKLDSRFGV